MDKFNLGSSLFVALLLAPTLAFAQGLEDRFGSAKFTPYQDIDTIKQLKIVYDFDFSDPTAMNVALSSIGSILRNTAEFGPHEIEPLKIVVVSHGPEIVVFAKQNYKKYQGLVDRAASLVSQGVRIEICKLAAAAEGFEPEDLYGFVAVVPGGPYALAYWQAKGYTLNAVGATMPSPVISPQNRDDLGKRR